MTNLGSANGKLQAVTKSISRKPVFLRSVIAESVRRGIQGPANFSLREEIANMEEVVGLTTGPQNTYDLLSQDLKLLKMKIKHC